MKHLIIFVLLLGLCGCASTPRQNLVIRHGMSAGEVNRAIAEAKAEPIKFFGIALSSEIEDGPTFRLSDGSYFENMEVVPDFVVYNDPESVAQGRDLQLEKAVEQLLQALPAK